MIHLVLAAALAAPTVIIDDFKFTPATVTVTAGQSVRFINKDQEAHTVTSTDHIFDSAGMDSGDTFTYRFAKPGRYTYFCTLHPWMKGVIVVKAAPK